MKRSLRSLFAVIALLCTVVQADVISEIRKTDSYRKALAEGAVAQIKLIVLDDNGVPVENASTKAVFDMTTYTETQVGTTDTNGVCILTDRTRGNSIRLYVEKDGYYKSERNLCLIGPIHAHSVSAGLWQPSPLRETIHLRKKRFPAQTVGLGDVLTVPVTNRWFGFDMASRTYAAPYGNGVRSDVEFFVTWDGLPPTQSRFCKLQMRFKDVSAGGYYAPLVLESSFPYSYTAADPFLQNISEICIVNRNGDPHMTKIPFREGSEFVFRTRCVLSEEGGVVVANYGSIRGVKIVPSWEGLPTLRFVYVFNPAANDRNLESMKW